MNTFRSTYGLRRVCLLATSLLLSASTIHLLNMPSEESTTHLSQGVRDLQAMSFNHRFAARCVEIIQSLAARWNIVLPEEALAVTSVAYERFASPSPSNFWAASIPREASFKSGFGPPIYSSDDSTFLQAPPVHHHARLPSDFTDPATHLDPNQVQNTFWTPFPSQTMPVPPQNIVPSMSIQSSPMEEKSGLWSLADRSVIAPGAQSGNNQEQSTAPANLRQASDFERWHWQ